MDKNTLSHYGWIVVLILILSVMLAFASPFGFYIKAGIESTANGLIYTNNHALSTVVKTDNSNKIPDGATYTTDGNTLTEFPETPQTGDTYEEGDYKYTYNKGFRYGNEWSVRVKDTSKTSYGEILNEIAGKPVTAMIFTFENCTNLKTSPTIPDSVTDMYGAFVNCSSLVNAPIIPDGVTGLYQTFFRCTSLTTAPTIPNSVTEMTNTFSNCTSLTTAPTIPNSVTEMSGIFDTCTSLTGTIEINADVIYSYRYCFANTSKPITLTGSSTMLSTLAATATRGNVTVG